MSDANGTCEYVLDPDEPETWGGEEEAVCHLDAFQYSSLLKDGKWFCPHDAEQGEKFCIFHLPPDEKSSQDVNDALIKIINDQNEHEIELIGARFGAVSVSGEQLSGQGATLFLTHSEFQSSVDFRGTIFEELSLDFEGVRFNGEVDFSNSVFQTSPFKVENMYGVNFRGSEFEENVHFTGANFECKFTFSGALFKGGADFDRVEFASHPTTERHQPLKISNITFYTWVDFSGSRFKENTTFDSINFGGEVDLDRVRFNKITFEDCSFENWFHFRNGFANSDFRISQSKFEEKVEFEDIDFDDSISIDEVSIQESFIFNKSIINGDIEILETSIGGQSTFKNSRCKGNVLIQNSKFLSEGNFANLGLSKSEIVDSELKKPNFKKSDLTDVDLSGSKILGGNLERSKLNRADLFGTHLKRTALYGAVIGDAQINEGTKFGSRCVYDPEFNCEPSADIEEDETGRLTKAAGQYRLIEQLARTNAFPDMVSHNFIRRQDIHREQHQQEGRWGRWLRATASKYVLEYGENPWRLIATGLIIVGTFGLLYPLVGGLQPTGGSPITASRVIDDPLLLAQSIYYSTLTFTTLGMGDFQPVGLGRMLTTLETSLGAIIIALLVFVFGRRAAR